ERVTGERAFEGSSTPGTLAAVLNQEPKSLPANVPDGMARAILSCLRKDPARRYQTMADLKVALEDLREKSYSRRQVPAPLRRRWNWAVLAATLLVARLSGLIAWRPWRTGPSPPPPKARRPPYI